MSSDRRGHAVRNLSPWHHRLCPLPDSKPLAAALLGTGTLAFCFQLWVSSSANGRVQPAVSRPLNQI